MISPSNLPSPAGYSFGSYEPIHNNTNNSNHRGKSDSHEAFIRQRRKSSVTPSLSLLRNNNNNNSIRTRSQSLDNNNNNSNNTIFSLHSSSSYSTSTSTSTSIATLAGKIAHSAHSAHITNTATVAATANASGTTMSSTTFQKINALSSTTTTTTATTTTASLSVALCRSLVLKYIYMTYLFFLQLLVWPTAAVKKFLYQQQHKRAGMAIATGSGLGFGAVDIGRVAQDFLKQYTLDNHLAPVHDSDKLNNNTDTSTNISINSNNHNSNNNNNNSNNNQHQGTTMLRRSSRFKSRSDLEEIAQSSTPSSSYSTTTTTTTTATTTTTTKRNSGGLVSRSSLLSSGYGTDSMAEDGGSGDNSTTPTSSMIRGNQGRLRQRMSRPMSGLGHGGFGARKKTLVLDLDETLIHSTSRGSRSQGYMVEVLVDRHACLYYVYKRPHVDYFLKKVSEWYKLVIFTASMAEYADPVIDWLDQNRTLFEKRYFRQACFFRNGSYLKDLTVVEQDLSSVCLLDNSPVSYSLNKENGIPIDSWIDDPNDEALLDLLPFLDALRFTEDVRSILSLRTI
ncbi:Nuclear envelope morphology protein 1 [Lobosporangium transversale]|nr:Nuclear envelope morphology protein 1 [Lobosporangium transversale]